MTTAYVSPPGFHRHRCPNPKCGWVWEHEDCFLSPSGLHDCPKCRGTQYQKYTGPARPGTRDPMRPIRKESPVSALQWLPVVGGPMDGRDFWLSDSPRVGQIVRLGSQAEAKHEGVYRVAEASMSGTVQVEWNPLDFGDDDE